MIDGHALLSDGGPAFLSPVVENDALLAQN